jgi:hypothetical protein
MRSLRFDGEAAELLTAVTLVGGMVAIAAMLLT